jgi:hypothetical protein
MSYLHYSLLEIQEDNAYVRCGKLSSQSADSSVVGGPYIDSLCVRSTSGGAREEAEWGGRAAHVILSHIRLSWDDVGQSRPQLGTANHTHCSEVIGSQER